MPSKAWRRVAGALAFGSVVLGSAAACGSSPDCTTVNVGQKAIVNGRTVDVQQRLADNRFQTEVLVTIDAGEQPMWTAAVNTWNQSTYDQEIQKRRQAGAEAESRKESAWVGPVPTTPTTFTLPTNIYAHHPDKGDRITSVKLCNGEP